MKTMEMMNDELRAALLRFGDAIVAVAEHVMAIIRDVADRLSCIDWTALAEIRAKDPDLFYWDARGPVRRVQLRRARKLMRRDD